jgi:peptidyl-prolyl cis-trans isomerase D
MAILSQIRSKSYLLIILVGLAMFMFVASPDDIMSFFNSKKQNSIGSVDGEHITREEFTEKVKSFTAANGGTNDSQASRQVWENIIGEKIFDKQLKKAGIVIGEKEIWKAIISDPQLQSNPQFQNEAGLFDEESVKTFIAEMKEDDTEEGKARWNNWLLSEKQIKQNLERNTYINAVSAGLGIPLEQAKREYITANTRVNGSFVFLPFSSIPDSTIQVTDAEIEAYVKAHKSQFKTNASRSIQYVVLDVDPSVEDKKDVYNSITRLIQDFQEPSADDATVMDTIKGFANTTDAISFVKAYSETPGNDNFIFKGPQPQATDSLFNLGVGVVVGPYEEGGYYKVSKVVEQKQVPSARASHILFAFTGSRATPKTARTKDEAKALAEQELAKIKGGADFATEAQLNSDDSSAQMGGDLNWFKEGMMVPQFNDWVFGNGTGEVGMVETEFGYHIIKKTDSKSELGIKVATLAKVIEPSEVTVRKAFEVAEGFNSKVSKDSKEFEKIAKDSKMEVRKAEKLSRMDENIAGLPGVNSQIVYWAFENQTEVGDIKRFDLDKSYVIAQVTMKQKEGLMSAAMASDRVKPILLNQKKTALLTKKLEKGTLASIAQTEKVMVQQLTDVSYNEPASSLMGDKSAIGAMLSMKENTIVRDVVGRNGVYAIQLGKRTVPVQINSYEPTRLQLEKAVRKDGNTIYGALREAANIGELQL